MGASGGIQKASGSQGRGVADAAAKYEKEFGPVRGEFLSQLKTALQTGGAPNSTIPSIQRAVESSQQATSDTLRGLNENLARQGLAGTGLGARTMASAELAGRQATSQTPVQAINAFLQSAPGMSLGSTQSILSALGSVGRNNSFGFQQSGGFLSS